MSKLPQVRRLLVEDFLEQKDWISKLFNPLNTFMDGVISVMTRGITLRDNCAADIISSIAYKAPTEADPIILPWSLSQRPVSLHVGNIVRTDGDTTTLSAASGVQWKYDGKKGLQITKIFGVTPSMTDKYTITYVIFTG